ncbi:MAG: hypothetical protein IPJ77_14255 [Planctomycetes bacterium]|nr:hypothetical protein [Planctomycetota bacterium]
MRERTNTGRAGAWLLLGLVSFLGLAAFFVARALRAPAGAPVVATPGSSASEARTNSEAAPAPTLERPARAESPATQPAPAPSTERTSNGTLVVSVASAGGEAWTGAFELWVEHRPRLGTRSLHPGAYTRHSGAEAHVEGLPAGEYALHARASGRRSVDASVTLEVGHVATARVQLERAGTIRGRLLDGADALDTVAVRLVSKDGRHADAVATDAEGRFVFESVLESDWRIEVGPPHDPLLKDWTIEYRGTELDLGERALEGLTTLLVTVHDEHGNPIPSARVWDGQLSGHFDLRTDENGTARARHLPPRQLRVFAEHADHGQTNRPIRIEAATPAQLELVLPR